MNAEDLDRFEALLTEGDMHLIPNDYLRPLIALARLGLQAQAVKQSLTTEATIKQSLNVGAWLCECGMQSRGQFCWNCGKREK